VRSFCPTRLISPLKTILVLLVLSGTFSVLAQTFGSSSLTVVIPGIRDEASSQWVDDARLVGSVRERYVIAYDDGGKKTEGKFGKYLKRLQPSFENEHVIRVNPNDPKSQELLHKNLAEIAKVPNASVVIDMDLGGWSLVDAKLWPNSEWKKQTAWAGKIAADLAEQHLAQHPESKTTLLAHSAGTDAAIVASQRESATGKPVFNQRPILMSPRSPDALPKNAFVILADGDFIASPGGSGSFNSTRTAEELQARGILVARIATENGSLSRNWPDLSSLSLRWAVVGNILTLGSALNAHTATHDFLTSNQKILVYAPGVDKPVEFPPTSLGKVITEVLKAETRGPNQTIKLDSRKLNDAATKLRASEPTPGIGGISLNALARLPISAEQVSKISYHSEDNLLYLEQRDGRKIQLPSIDKEVLRLAYQIAYRDNQKPELSIGSPPEGGGGNIQLRAGQTPVYYLGKTDRTMLGLVMYRADEALGCLAFCSTKFVQSVSDQVIGFHSLPELYPQGYADHPGQSRYPSAGTVFLNSSLVELTWSPRGDRLEFGSVGFDLRFDQPGPAEDAFAAFFVTHFDEIVRTKLGEPLQALIPYAQAVAFFRWLKANDIALNPSEFQGLPVSSVFTPHEVPLRPSPKLEDIASRAPTILFGAFGPERIIRADGRETVVTYERGLPIRVRRFDGDVLEVKRDALGNPVGLVFADKSAAAFYIDPEMGFVFAENVELVENERTVTVTVNDKTIAYPDNQPEATTRLILARFAFNLGEP
jgi:hypothetical protein